MPAQMGRFSKVALIRVRADRGSWALGNGLLSASPPKADLGPLTPQSSTVVAYQARESWMAPGGAKALITQPNFWKQFYRKFPGGARLPRGSSGSRKDSPSIA
jgi:hypothetical protein